MRAQRCRRKRCTSVVCRRRWKGCSVIKGMSGGLKPGRSIVGCFRRTLLWGHGDYRTEDLQTFVLRVTELNCVLLDESNLRELMHRGWPPESAESALELIENLLP